jgi:hypothetical protein
MKTMKSFHIGEKVTLRAWAKSAPTVAFVVTGIRNGRYDIQDVRGHGWMMGVDGRELLSLF